MTKATSCSKECLPGDYTFTAEKTGFVNQGYQAQAPGTSGAPFRLAAGQSVKGVEFRLSANAIVSGIVTTPEGDPVPGKQVTLLIYHYWTRGVRQWFGRDRATTDDRGQFRIAGIAPGQYLLSVSAPDFDVPDPQAATLKEALVNTYFPGVSDIKAATPIALSPGLEMTGLKIELRREPVYTLRVAARNQSGDLVPDAALSIRSPNTTTTALVSAINPLRSNDGYFVFRNLPAGHYIIQARPRPQALVPESGAGIAQLYGRLEIDIADKDINDAEIRLAPNIPAIDVNVTVVDGEAAAVRAARPTLGIMELDMPGLNNRGFRLLSGDQWFRADSMARAIYGVRLDPLPEGMYLKSVRYGGLDVTRSPLDLTNAGAASMDIVISGKAADVSGVVRNEKGDPVAAVAVALWPKTPDRSTLWEGAVVKVTDAAGVFRLTNLAPGDYYLAGWEQTGTGQAENPAFRALFAAEAEEIDLDEGSHITRDLKPFSAAETERRVATLP